MLSEEKKQEFIGALTQRIRANGRSEACPMCGNEKFLMVDACLVNVLQPDVKSVTLTGASIPTLAIICDNCGYLSQHAVGALGGRQAESDEKGYPPGADRCAVCAAYCAFRACTCWRNSGRSSRAWSSSKSVR